MRRVACWVLICLFAAGFQPSRGETCRCTAERNCGCACWKQAAPAAAAKHGESEPTRPCCAPKQAPKASPCGAHDPEGEQTPTIPETRTGSHDTGQPMDWLTAAAPRLATPDASDRAPERPRFTISNDSLEPQIPPP